MVNDATITDVQTCVVEGNFDWTFVRVYTDAGVTGTGEAILGERAADIAADAAPILEGEDPLDVSRLTETLYRRLSYTGGNAGAVTAAISGLEIALFDLAGRLLEVPAHRLLGGKFRDDVRVYCDTHAGAHLGRSEDDAAFTPESYAAAAEDVVADGFDAMKFDLDADQQFEGDPWNRHLAPRNVQNKAEIVEAVLDRVGDRADVAFDCHWEYGTDSAIRLASALEEYDVWFLEDPAPPENAAVPAEITSATETPICTGESLYRAQGFRDLVTRQAADVVQPDPPKCGGLRETRRIAELAELYEIPVSLHNVASPLGTVACAHVAAACPNFLALEYHARDVDWWGDLVGGNPIDDGSIHVPDEPGLGVDLDLDVVAEHRYAGETLFDEA
ncbi:mandelate racemase/muconate lactonizing enzyme family protein [Halomicrobium salinisoli]|uniref:mandelate racemase/muconate lactonizing enzyme family protein n=1 Tax=Halomicrobium salinisoli TaxID=2878391 RepID=UPI001CF05330|nr:mandelate racemase/muconate lactonizing enzyme family protein [Halomicrobium salinisoli]